jgi:hypothetical protein
MLPSANTSTSVASAARIAREGCEALNMKRMRGLYLLIGRYCKSRGVTNCQSLED